MQLRLVGAVFVVLSLAGLPPAAAEDRQTFARAVVDLTRALEGLYGDEGPHALAALESMSAALAHWDRRLRHDQARVAAEADTLPPSTAARLHAAIGAALHERGRLDEAVAALERAIASDPSFAEAYLRRGLVRLPDEPAQALRDFHQAFARDADVVAAYWLLQAEAAVSTGGAIGVTSDRTLGPTAGTDRTLDVLATVYREHASGSRRADLFPDARLLPDTQVAPIFPLVRYAEGYGHLAAGRYHRALDALRDAAAGDPLLTDTALRLDTVREGIAAVRRGDVAAAVAQLGAGAAHAPESSSVRRLLAMAHRAAGRLDDSVAHLEAAVGIDPLDERTWLELVSTLRLTADQTRLEEALERALEVLPDSGALRWANARRLGEVDRGEAMRHELEVLPVDPMLAGRGHVRAVLGQLHMVALRLDDAMDVFRRSVLVGPNDFQAQVHLGEVYRTEGYQRPALAAFVAAALLGPDRPEAHTGIGQVQLAAHRIDEAALAFRRALAADATHAEAHYGLAQVFQRMGANEPAALHFERYRELQQARLDRRRHELDTSALVRDARLHEAHARHDQAVESWRAVVARDPDDPGHRQALAEALVRAGALGAAVEVLETLASTVPDPGIHRRLAELYFQQGRLDERAGAQRDVVRRQGGGPSPAGGR
jgi:tetratricopeptide (TPR) repeat protein